MAFGPGFREPTANGSKFIDNRMSWFIQVIEKSDYFRLRDPLTNKASHRVRGTPASQDKRLLKVDASVQSIDLRILVLRLHKPIHPKIVFGLFDNVQQTPNHLFKLCLAHRTLKDRLLHALPKVLTSLCHLPQPFPPSSDFSRDIVANQHIHATPTGRERADNSPDRRAAPARATAPAHAAPDPTASSDPAPGA